MDYVGKTIHWSEVRITDHVPGQVCTYEPVAHGYIIGEHLLNSVSCRMDYSLDFFCLAQDMDQTPS